MLFRVVSKFYELPGHSFPLKALLKVERAQALTDKGKVILVAFFAALFCAQFEEFWEQE